MIIAAASRTSKCCFVKCNHVSRNETTTHMTKPTLVIGASLKENRFSNICVKTLATGHFPVVAIGLREGLIDEIPVYTGFPELNNIHTVTLYLGPENQKKWYDYVLKLNPKRVIFNPGTENEEFENLLLNAGIQVIEDCTIVKVQGGRY
jgi:predicted CoA-binding protein